MKAVNQQNLPKYAKNKKIAIIHGFGTSVKEELLSTATKGKLKATGEYKEFKAFEHLVKAGDAKVFRWNESFNATKLNEFTSIKKYVDLYRREKQKALSNELQNVFKNFLNDQNPEIIVCHSMGCYLILGYLEKFELPKSVKKIFLVQGDFDKKYELKNTNAIQRIESGELRLINIYCPWDTTLMISPFVNKLTIPAGLTRMRNPYFVDILFPLGNNINLHNASIKSTDLLDFVLKY